MDSSSAPSSPLSSVGSMSPPDGLNYPSPAYSSLPDTRLPSEAGDIPESTPDQDGPPPMKKRRVSEPKPRTTEYLDLRNFGEGTDEHICHQEEQMKRLVSVLRNKRKIVVVAGAGISVSAGIPDFRSSHGLFSTLRSQHKLKSSGKELFDASVYKNDSSTTSFHSMVRELSHLTKNAKPTPFHDMLATLAEEGRLLRLYSQNVDGIDTSLEPLATKVPLNQKGPWPKTIQLHGGLAKMNCSKCGHLQDFDGALFEGPEAPACPECEMTDSVRIAGGLRSHGIGRMRPRMVLYNEYNPDEEAIGAVSAADLKKVADAVIVVGTSLKIPGIRRLVKEMCKETRDRRNGFAAWINLDGEPGLEFKDCWDLVVRGECDEVARHTGLPKWDDKDIGQYSATTPEADVAREKRIIDKVLVTPANIADAAQAFPTPGASPRAQSPTPGNAFMEILKTKTKAGEPLKKVAAVKSAKRKAPTAAPAKKPRAPRKPKAKKPAPAPKIKLSLGVSKSGTIPKGKIEKQEEMKEATPSTLNKPIEPVKKPRKPLPDSPRPSMTSNSSKSVVETPKSKYSQEADPPTNSTSSPLSEVPSILNTPSPSPTAFSLFRQETITPPSCPPDMRRLLND